MLHKPGAVVYAIKTDNRRRRRRENNLPPKKREECAHLVQVHRKMTIILIYIVIVQDKIYSLKM